MTMIQRVTIAVDPPYEVLIGHGLLKQAGEQIRSVLEPCRLAVITDTNVGPLYLEALTQSLESSGYEVAAYAFPAGEIHKNLQTWSGILQFLAESQLTRSDAVLALGGGVCGDMAGFAAGCYLRGVRFIQIPTTLLAAVDSSVGGKTAVDLSAGKNLSGLIHQPAAVICDLDCLDSLPPEIFADGMAEAVKTGILSGAALFDQCDRPASQLDLASIIRDCVAFKGRVVAEDEFETGLRKTLNLGHTAGHAIEVCSDYRISHGRAVAMGLVLMARAGEAMGWTKPGLSRRISQVLGRHGLPVETPFTAEALALAAMHDKKRSSGSITLVVPRDLGSCELRTIAVSELKAVFAAGLEG